MAVRYRVYIRNGDYQRVDELTDWLSLTLVRRFNAVGTWELEVARSGLSASLITKTSGIIVTRDAGDGPETIFSGSISTEYTRTATTLRVAGRDDNVFLDVPALPTPTGPPYVDEYDVWTGQASAVMLALVHVNVGPGARVDRRAQGWYNAADPGLGGTITGRAKFQPLIVLLAELALSPTAGGLGFRALQSDTVENAIEFSVYEPRDQRETAKFSIEAGTAQDFEDVYQHPPANYVYVLGGDGLGANRTIVEDGDDASIAEIGRQIEMFVDARDVADAGELNQRLAEALAGAVSSRKVTVTPFQIQSLEYGPDYELGDLVTFAVDGETFEDVIREVTIELTADRGVVVTPMVGNANTSNDDITARQIAAVDARLTNIERSYNVPLDSIDEPMLYALDAPADNEILTYDSTSGRFEWQAINALAAVLSITSLTATGNVQGSRLISTVATGTAPLSVTSTTEVANLNAALLQGHPASDFALAGSLGGYLPLTGGTLTGPLTMELSSGNDQQIKLKHNSGAGGVFLGGSNSATPDLIVKNNVGSQIGRFTNAGLLMVGSQATAVSTAGADDVQCNDVWLVSSGSNFRRLQASGSSFQLSGNADVGTDLTISSAGLVTIKALKIDNNDLTVGTNRLQINSTGIGFLGAAPIARPTVTGTRTGTLAQLQAAFASLTSALDGSHLGLITDLTS